MSRGHFKQANKMIYEIKKAGRINEYDLIDIVEMSIWSYKTIKPWFAYRFRETVVYDKKNKEWSFLLDAKKSEE
jgi:hypothetical protein